MVIILISFSCMQAAGTPSFHFVKAAAELSYRLLGAAAFIPDVVLAGQGTARWRILHKALTTSEDVAACVRQLEAAYPRGALSVCSLADDARLRSSVTAKACQQLLINTRGRCFACCPSRRGQLQPVCRSIFTLSKGNGEQPDACRGPMGTALSCFE